MSKQRPRHFLDLIDIPVADLRHILATSRAMKKMRRGAAGSGPLAGATLAMIFDRPSTRTRVSFDVAMRQLGGESIMLTGQDMQLGRGETIADTARVLSRYVDGIMIRTLEHATLSELAELKDRHASVIAEVRGEGLLMGLRMVPPASAMVDELRNEKMITVAAGDNVVRLLPPLIIGEEEVSEAVARIDRACARLAHVNARPKEKAS